MATALDIIESALRKISVLGNGSSLSSDEADQALSTLNDMLVVLSLEGCVTYNEEKETFSLTSGQESYQIGSGLDFSTTAPFDITYAYITSGDIDYSLKKIGEADYGSISQKTQSGGVPGYFYYDGNYSTPRLYLWPAPTGGTITIYSRKVLSSFASLSSTFSMPEQYKAMLINNLAVWIAPEYEREASSTIKMIADRSLKAVKVQNSRNNVHTVKINDIPAGYSNYGYNIYGGDY